MFPSIGIDYAIFTPVIFLITLVAGLFLVTRRGRFYKFAGWYTLKPFIATPPSVVLVVLLYSAYLPFWGLFPGAVLTWWIFRKFPEVLQGKSKACAIPLLALDLLRWGSALVCVIFNAELFCGEWACNTPAWLSVFSLAAVILPFLFALAALACSGVYSRLQ